MRAPPVVALVGEDAAHAVLLGALLRGSICATARASGRDWIADNIHHDPVLDGQEDLNQILPGLRYTSSIRVTPTRINGKPLKLRGFLGDEPQEPGAHRWRLILTTILATEPEIVLVAADTDGDPVNLAGLRQVVRFFESRDPDRVIVLAAPHQDAESWFVTGFQPTGDDEHAAHATVIGELDFDPCVQPERLTAHPNDARTDAKRILRRLLLLDVRSAPLTPDELRDHHERLLGDLERLRRRGVSTGLVAFLDDLQRRVVPRVVPGA